MLNIKFDVFSTDSFLVIVFLHPLDFKYGLFKLSNSCPLVMRWYFFVVKVVLQSLRETITVAGSCNAEPILSNVVHNIVPREVIVGSDMWTVCIDLLLWDSVLLPIEKIFD